MKNILAKTYDLIKTKPDLFFFYLFLSTFTLSVRKVLYFFPINNSFNEYSGVYIYLSDIFLNLTFFFWIFFILCNNYKLLSIYKLGNLLKCFTWNNAKKTIVPRGTFSVKNFIFHSGRSYKQVIHNFVLFFPLFMAFFSFISILWATNQNIATYRSVKLLEFVLLFYYVIYRFVPRPPASEASGTNIGLTKNKLFHVEQLNKKQEMNCSTWNNSNTSFIIIIISGFIQSIIAIWQFIVQHSIGLFWLKESIISPVIPGVAKVIINNHVLIRSYGLFPHPNILGGFLVFSIVATLTYFKLFYTCPVNCSTWNNLTGMEQFKKNPSTIVPRGTIYLILFSIQSIALLLSFSKSAIIGLFIGLFYIFIIVPRGTMIKHIKKLFHVEQFRKRVILLALVVLFLLINIKPDIYSLFIKSLYERGFYLNVSRGTFLQHPFLGIGSGQFIFELQKIPTIQTWQFQPVHNVFLLIGNEFGIFIMLGFIFWLCVLIRKDHFTPVKLFHVEQLAKQIKNKTEDQSILLYDYKLIYIKATLLAFIFIMLFDHYFWDIQQGQIMFWLTLGLFFV